MNYYRSFEILYYQNDRYTDKIHPEYIYDYNDKIYLKFDKSPFVVKIYAEFTPKNMIKDFRDKFGYEDVSLNIYSDLECENTITIIHYKHKKGIISFQVIQEDNIVCSFKYSVNRYKLDFNEFFNYVKGVEPM